MTDQDLQQLRLLIREEVAAANQGLREEFIQRLERAVEAIAMSISEFRTEMNQRFESLERRLDRVETQIHSFTIQIGGMSKSLSDAERLDTHIIATQAAQQNAINDLYAKVKDLERRIQGSQ